MKKVREDAIPPLSLHNSEARIRAEDLKCVGTCMRVRERESNKTPTWG